MIRPATTDDLPSMLDMGEDFARACGVFDLVGYDRESFAATLDRLAESGGLFVMDKDGEAVGMAAAVVYPHYFNAGLVGGQEVFWWVDPAHRGGVESIKLLVALERWAAAQGAKTFSMLCLDALGRDDLHRFYTKLGYRPTEHVYMREVQ